MARVSLLFFCTEACTHIRKRVRPFTAKGARKKRVRFGVVKRWPVLERSIHIVSAIEDFVPEKKQDSNDNGGPLSLSD